MEMKKYKLRDLVEIKNGKDHKDLKNGFYPVYGSGGIMRYVDEFLYNKPSVLLPRKGTLDNIQYANKPFWTVDTIYYTEIKENLVNAYYLYNYLRLLDLSNLDSGTGVPSMTFESYYNISIQIPSLKIQQKISIVLSSLDDKIALNKKMNQKLERIAKRLYDYWFVQHDFPDKNGHPYKTSGVPMTYNPTLKREIPEGWEVDNLYAVADYINGLACQNNRPKSGENALPVIKIREMSEGITSDTEEVSENIPSKYIVENGDILFSWSATLLVMIWAGGKGGLNQHIFRVVPKESFPKEFVYQLLSDYVVNFQQIALSRKTTMGHITSDYINLSRVVLPPENVLKRYAEKVRPIFDKIVRNQVEFRKLTALRDKLLPLLMNGQVTVV